MKAESTRQRSRARNPARAASQRAAKKLGAAGSRTITLEAVYDVDWINEFPLESAVVNRTKRVRRRKLSILRIEPLAVETANLLPKIATGPQSRGLEHPADRQLADEWRAVLSASTAALSASSAALTRLGQRAGVRAKADAVVFGRRVSRLSAAAVDSYHRADLGRRTANLRQHARTIKGWARVPVVAAMTALILAVTTASSSAPGLRREPVAMAHDNEASQALSREILAVLGQPEALPTTRVQSVAPPKARVDSTSHEERARGEEAVRPEQPARRGDRSEYVGALLVASTPPAAVFVNRTYMGETPLTLSNLRAGSHVVWLDRDGFDRWSGAVSVVAGRVTRVDPKLRPITTAPVAAAAVPAP